MPRPTHPSYGAAHAARTRGSCLPSLIALTLIALSCLAITNSVHAETPQAPETAILP